MISPLILVIVACFLGSLALVLIKIVIKKLSFRNLLVIPTKNKLRLFVAFMLYGFSVVLYIIALKFGKLSAIYPTAATSYIWITLFSHRFLREKINRFKIYGVSVIMIGVML